MATELSAVRTLFWDCQEWGWIPRRFDPGRSLAVPRAVKALIGRKPRIIADAVWARLLWAGLHLETPDLPDTHNTAYPVQCVRALAVVWLFAGLRSDEILRLRVGCVRWQSIHDAPEAEPMSLFELQAWLGHGSPASTQHYVAISPTRLARAYTDAGYFARNVRAIEVLIDQDTLKQAVADGQPWRYYDLGHGLCTYEFFEQCAHRMACARCDFYRPGHPPSRNFSMPRTTSCASSSRSPLPTKNAPPSTATSTPSTVSPSTWRTDRRPQARLAELRTDGHLVDHDPET